MKKVFLMMSLLVLSLGMQAQTKYHDVEANDATGAVKCIKSSVMGREDITNFSKDGKMESEGIKDAKYDENGYLISVTRSFQGNDVTIKYIWENGRIKSQTMSIMGQEMTATRTYNEKGAPASEKINMGGQEMENPYTDYKYDDHGNWISRKASMMGREMEQTRTIEYYE